jgi:2-C-methyl-D-erythritol 4-phosphate cytidylyltransferase/2-C-methyl-D-erythritol 2,4-cyclodiphosphate synthase
MRVAAILVAAGKGERLGGGVPKQFLELAPGKTMLQMSVDALAGCPLISEIIVAVPEGSVAGLDTAASASAPARLTEGSVPRSDRSDCNLVLVEGGERRQDSVARAFARVSPDADVIVIHDAARPFASSALVERTIRTAAEHGAAIAALAVVDTVKQTSSRDGARVIAATLPRDTIFLAQTPQAFRRDVLTEAMAAADALVTDEAMLVERAGFQVHLVDGEAGNIKVTTASDLARARAIASEAQQTSMRIGTGYDLHRLVEGRPLILAGVRIPFDRGLLGHSDADIVCHAVTDAMLGAAALGDIGALFPDTDPRWKDADSLELLRAAAAKVRDAGFAIGNVDVTVIAERPTLRPHVDTMRANLARALGIEVSCIAVKGKTNEGLGETGRGEAMACHAVALLTSG